MGHCFFFKAGHILWFVSAGHENAAECMTGVGKSNVHRHMKLSE